MVIATLVELVSPQLRTYVRRMKFKEFNLDKYEQRKIRSPGLCIYCGRDFSPEELTDEHVIPFALGHNTLIYEKSSCRSCAATIQRYEQEVLKKQLGNFRLQVDAPSRSKKKDRPTTLQIPFVEVDDRGESIRDLGKRTFTLDDAPMALNLWTLPKPRILRGEVSPGNDRGRPWSFIEPRALEISRKVAQETGANHVAVKIGEVNRDHFQRFLTKTAHAYAVAELGMGSFRPFLNDFILNKSHDLSKYVGGTLQMNGGTIDAAETVRMQIGETNDFVVVYFQIYPSLKSPAYVVVVGERNDKTERRLKATEQHYI